MVCGDHWGKYLKIKAEPLKGSPLLAETLGTIVKMSLFSAQTFWIKTLGTENQSSSRCHIYRYCQGIDTLLYKGSLFEVMYTKPKLNATRINEIWIYFNVTISLHFYCRWWLHGPFCLKFLLFFKSFFLTTKKKKKKNILRKLSFRESSKVTQWFPPC